MMRRIGKVIPQCAMSTATLAVIMLACAACNRQADKAPPIPRVVRTFTVEPPQRAEDTSFTGHIEAPDQVSLSFRIGGRLSQRSVGVGAVVGDGDIVARLDPENELNNLRSARAALISAQGVLRKMQNQHQRQSHLFERGVTTRADFEAAEQAHTAAQAQVEAAQARVRTAEEIVSFTTLKADAPGVVIRIGAEPAEVVAAGSMIVQLARREGRDAVFEVPADALRVVPADATVHVALAGDPAVIVRGRVREVAPQPDPITRTFRVRVGLSDPPASFRLGATVSGTIKGREISGVRVPAAALTRQGPDTGVWIVDPATQTVSLRKLDVLSSDPATALVGHGLALGDIVAAAGANLLKEGQIVRLAGVETR
ncbi:MAG: efflux transporter, family, subunit [Hyphomicrobiales bacterium]|nr:efflux transporter, family, subunit [Hyphomicrobiales bacterium]